MTEEEAPTREEQRDDDRAGRNAVLRPPAGSILVRRDDLVDALVRDTQFFSDLPKRKSGPVQLHDLPVVGISQARGLVESGLVLISELPDLLESVHVT